MHHALPPSLMPAIHLERPKGVQLTAKREVEVLNQYSTARLLGAAEVA